MDPKWGFFSKNPDCKTNEPPAFGTSSCWVVVIDPSILADVRFFQQEEIFDHFGDRTTGGAFPGCQTKKLGQKSAAKNRLRELPGHWRAFFRESDWLAARGLFVFEPRCVEPGGGWREPSEIYLRRRPRPCSALRAARGTRAKGGPRCSTTTTTTTMTTTASATGPRRVLPARARAPLSGRHGWRPRPTRARCSSRRRARLAAVVLASRRGDAPAGGSGETRRLKIFSVNDGERRTARGETRRFVGNLINPRVPARTAREGIPPRSMGMEKGPPRARILPRFHAGSRSVTRDARTIVSNPGDPTARARPAPRPDKRRSLEDSNLLPSSRSPGGRGVGFPDRLPARAPTFDPIPVDPPARRDPGRIHPRAARC